MASHHRGFREVVNDRSGNFAMMFALMAVPVITAMGCAVDYSYALTIKNQLQSAADNAAVGALAEQSVGVIESLSKGTTGELKTAEADAEQLFKANIQTKLAAYLTGSSINVQRSTNSMFTSEVKFEANVPTSFLGIIGINSIKVAGVAQGSFIPATYVDFYLMLDNSPSMGLGATTSDISTLENNTSDTCGFACHIDNSTTDYYSLAKKLGVTTRIQVVAAAAQAMMNTAKTTRRYSDQYRMAVYSMGPAASNVALTNVASMSSDLTDVGDKAAKIDLMSIPYQGYNNDQQTDFDLMLSGLKTTMGTSGTGLNSGDRQKVLFLVSDGVNDSYKSGTCNRLTTSGTYTGRCQQPIDYSICTKIKDAGIRIAVLYTTYQPLEKNSWYRSWIKPFNDKGEITANMKACASTDLFFEVSPSQGISDAMNALFLKVVNMPRLTG